MASAVLIIVFICLEKSSFHGMIPPLRQPCPPGLMAHCDAPALPGKFPCDCVQVMPHNRNRGMPERRGQSQKECHNYYRMISPEHVFPSGPASKGTPAPAREIPRDCDVPAVSPFDTLLSRPDKYFQAGTAHPAAASFLRGYPSPVKGAGFRVPSRRRSQVQLLLHASFCDGITSGILSPAAVLPS